MSLLFFFFFLVRSGHAKVHIQCIKSALEILSLLTFCNVGLYSCLNMSEDSAISQIILWSDLGISVCPSRLPVVDQIGS